MLNFYSLVSKKIFNKTIQKQSPRLFKLAKLGVMSLPVLALIQVMPVRVEAHGLIEFPASRAQFCGVLTKPDEASSPSALYPECADAFKNFATGGYSFMSILTHTRGRLRPLPALAAGETPPANEVGGVTPELPENVCGFNAETFNNGPTPWDEPIDWPTNTMTSGRHLFTWNIEWGPHFDDTQEFHYWITKEDFEFEVGRALTWDDFEEQPFCKLDFDRTDFDANPDIIADPLETKFDTYCDVPERSGRHVIYAEWGRNFYTWERFHSCIDVDFNASQGVAVTADIAADPQGEIYGAGSLSLSASQSTGDNLSYMWSLANNTTDAEYVLADANAESTLLTFTDPSQAGSVDVYLTVSSGEQQASQVLTINHQPQTIVSQWQYQQVLTTAKDLQVGDTVQVRVVLGNGQDIYLPESPLLISDSIASAEQWPFALANAINNADNGYIAIGVLDVETDSVAAVVSATANNIYANSLESIASIFVNIDSTPVVDPTPTTSPSAAPTATPTPTPTPTVDPTMPPNVTLASCEYQVSAEWNSGFSGKIVITNIGSEVINGWAVNWSYSDGSSISQFWNAVTSGSYSASNLSWNATINPGASVEFGFNGNKGANVAEVPQVSGDICQ